MDIEIYTLREIYSVIIHGVLNFYLISIVDNLWISIENINFEIITPRTPLETCALCEVFFAHTIHAIRREKATTHR